MRGWLRRSIAVSGRKERRGGGTELDGSWREMGMEREVKRKGVIGNGER